MIERFQSDTSDARSGRGSHCTKTKAKLRFTPFASTWRTPFTPLVLEMSVRKSQCRGLDGRINHIMQSTSFGITNSPEARTRQTEWLPCCTLPRYDAPAIQSPCFIDTRKERN